MNLTPEFLAELKRKAEAATPGPWREVFDGAAVSCVRAKDNSLIRAPGFPRNSAFISAVDPQTVLALIAEIDRLNKIKCSEPVNKENAKMESTNIRSVRGVGETVTKADLYLSAFFAPALQAIGWKGGQINVQAFTTELQKYIPVVHQLMQADLVSQLGAAENYQKTGT